MPWLELPGFLVYSQGSPLLPPSSIIQVFLPYLLSGYEPGSQVIFIDEAILLYCIEKNPRVGGPIILKRGTSATEKGGNKRLGELLKATRR